MINNRKISKGFKDNKALDDALMVKEIVIPFYINYIQEILNGQQVWFIKTQNIFGDKFNTNEIITHIQNLLKI